MYRQGERFCNYDGTQMRLALQINKKYTLEKSLVRLLN